MKRWMNLASAVFLLAGVVFMLIYSLSDVAIYLIVSGVLYVIGGVLRVIAYVKNSHRERKVLFMKSDNKLTAILKIFAVLTTLCAIANICIWIFSGFEIRILPSLMSLSCCVMICADYFILKK